MSLENKIINLHKLPIENQIQIMHYCVLFHYAILVFSVPDASDWER